MNKYKLKNSIDREAIERKARREYSHRVWQKRQSDYQLIKERDCYGYKSAKVQNVGGPCERGIKA